MFILTDVLKSENNYTTGIPTQLCKFECDTSNDLPNISQTNYTIQMGSYAHSIQNNGVYAMQSDGTWVLQNADGTAGYTQAEVDQLIQDTKDYADGEIVGAINDLDVPAIGGTTRYIYSVSQSDGKVSASYYNSDSTPTTGSTKLVQSGGVKTYVDNTATTLQTAIDGKQDILTIDSIPESGSDNVVRSGGIVNWVYGTTPNTIASGDDLNDYYTPGTYRAATAAIAASLYNCPTTSGFRLEVVSTISAASSGYQLQRLYPNNSEGEFFMRRRLSASSGNWADWYRFAGTVVQPINTPNSLQLTNLAQRFDTLDEPEELEEIE